MAELTIRDAEEAVTPLKAREVVPFKRLQAPLLRAALLAAVIIVLAAVNTPLLMAGLARIFTPWQAVTYPTRTYIELADKEIVVKEGDSVQIRAWLSGEVPHRAKLALRTGKGKPRNRTLEIVNGSCQYNMAAAFRSFDYCISAGDANSDWHTVTVISSPRIETSEIRLVFPSYMNRPAESLEAMTLTVPESTQIEWTLQLDRPVSRAAFTIEGGHPTPLSISKDGLTVKHTMGAHASRAYSFSWVEKEHGFSFDSSKHYLQVAPDQPPQIELTSPQKNIYATLGRQLVLAYRVRDDHGIGDAKIIFRHDNAPERYVPFSSKSSEGRGVQHIDWDYRSVLKDLDIGESVTFSIEASDLYPAPDGPHRVRSQSRRVSFLSREDYLKHISARKERLLSQLRTVYRQQRSAYDVIKNLDPADDAFEQTCFLESSRQDILSERIMVLGGNIQALVEDLLANHITEESEIGGLNRLQSSLKAITETLISKAASQLRDLGPSNNSDTQDVAQAANTVNKAARELASLVLQLGINQAMEVFARELHVIAQTQSALRVETLESVGNNAALSEKQDELAAWLSRLLAELSGNRDYSKSPLTIVRLSRMIKDMRKAEIEPSMHHVASLLGAGKLAEAARLQDDVIKNIFRLECYIRVGAEYDALLGARDLFTSGIDELNRISLENDGRSAQQFNTGRAELKDTLGELYLDLRLLIIPPVPAPQPRLLDEEPAEIPLVDDLIGSAQQSLQDAVQSLEAGQRDASQTQQQRAAESFHKLNKIVERRIEEITKTSRYSAHSAEGMERSRIIRELFTSQLRLIEKTEDAEADEISGVYLAPSQQHLSKEVLGIQRRLERKNKNVSSSSRLVPPMLELLGKASDAMLKAYPALQANQLGDAIEHQDNALAALEKAIAMAQHESDGWLGLANLLIVTEGASLPAKYMDDIVAEQRELIAETTSSTPESLPHLVQVQENLGRAVPDVILLLDAAGASIDFEQALTFAGSDMGLSALKLKSGQLPEAMEAQAFAADALTDLAKQLKASETQFYYFVNVLEFLQEMFTDGAVVLNNLSQLRDELENAEDKDLLLHTERLRALQEESQSLSTLLYRTTGREDYTRAHEYLTSAIKELKAGRREACLDEVASAEDSLKENIEELRELIVHIGIIPDVIPAEAPQEYTVMLDMVTLLVQQKELSYQMHRAEADQPAGFAPKLRELEETCNELLQSTRQHAFVVAARKSTSEAVTHLEKASRLEAFHSLHQSETKLRQCVLEYALYYIESKRSMGGKKVKRGKSGIVTMFRLSNKLRPAYDKDWGGVEGEDPKDGRTEWEVLGSRDRAALNENFVRELPLEHREVLKDYYERLTQ